MKLIGYSLMTQRCSQIRTLTDEEIANYKNFNPVFFEAKNRLKLFQILIHNYNEWTNYVNSLLSAKRQDDPENDFLQLDRLLLNYLASAYAIQEHFEVSFNQRFKNTEKSNEYSDFIDKLCQTSWEFGFFLDFRDHVQHCGLGIGGFNRVVTSTSVTLKITHEAKKLLSGDKNKDKRNWKLSKLTEDKGELNLVDLLHDFHGHMLQNFGTFVIKTFFSELFPIAQFYSKFKMEVQAINPSFKFYFMDGDPKIIFGQGKTDLSLPLMPVPNDVFAELGIIVSDQNQNTKPTADQNLKTEGQAN